ncbi:hypothetical protein [Caulobacter sp. RL271]|jgi:hypothetical protein|uniref:Uncharacterized protein n=1 Tax=Caulobacter segnis TaxID=88688 RepID=A0ABY4ZW19_9CAUL|nr:hypothetical protein [Caulobacter segnis]USQ96905.1 hypothetical protein MZV50_04875 [Caulobacter segnis]
MKPVIIFQPGMVGDLFFIQKIVKTYAATGRRVIMPVLQKHSWVYDTLVMPANVETPILDTEEFDFRDEVMFLADKIAMSPIEGPNYTYLSLFFSWRYAPEQTMDLKYQVAGVPMEDWSDHVELKRDREKEEHLFRELGLDDGVPYCLVNETCSTRTMPFPYRAPEKEVRLRFVEGYSLVDWSTVIERAARIASVDTSLVLLVEVLKIRGVPLHVVSRYEPPSFRELQNVLKLAWLFYFRPEHLQYA